MKLVYAIVCLLALGALFYFFPFNKNQEESRFSKASFFEFAGLVSEEISRLDKGIKVDFDTEKKTLVLTKNSEKSVVQLMNVYDDYVNSPFTERVLLIQKYAKRFVYPETLPDTFEEAKSRLVPNLWMSFWMEKELNREKPQTHRIVFKDYSPEFKICLVWVNDEQGILINEECAGKWGKNFEEMYEAALENLRKKSEGNSWKKIREGLYQSNWKSPDEENPDFNQPSRILIPELFKDASVKGTPVVFLIKRDLVLVTGAMDSEGLVKAAEISRECCEDGRFMSGMVFELQDQKWVPFLPDRSDPSFEALSTLRNMTRNREYAEQKYSLEKAYKDKLFVAAHTLYKEDPGSDYYRTTTLLTQFVPTLLPKTDDVCFFARESEYSVTIKRKVKVPWDVALGIVGHLFTDIGVYPPRYKVEGFPSEEELNLMEELAHR